MAEILVNFEPFFSVTMPIHTGPFVGKVKIVLPELHIKLYDLSMGIDLLQGAHIGSDARLFALNLDIPEPGITSDKIYEFIKKSEKELREMHRIAQAELDKTFLLDKKRGD